jgi:hypothetical protein
MGQVTHYELVKRFRRLMSEYRQSSEDALDWLLNGIESNELASLTHDYRDSMEEQRREEEDDDAGD